jgi:hypothetical protein
MTTPNLESALLAWIHEESEHESINNETPRISIKLLLLRLALENRDRPETVTHSIEVSLQAFERANLFRSLMQLSKRGFVSFIGSGGKPLSLEAIQELYAEFLAGKAMGEVALSPMGAQEIERKRKLEAKTERPPLSLRAK